MKFTKLAKNLFNAYVNEVAIEANGENGRPIRAAVALPFVWVGSDEFIEEFEKEDVE